MGSLDHSLEEGLLQANSVCQENPREREEVLCAVGRLLSFLH
jgi:hypothetical protein